MQATAKQVAVGLFWLFVSVTVAAFMCGWLFNALEWLRTFDMPATASSLAKAPMIVHPRFAALRPLAEFLAWYNGLFSGYGRFGSGLGAMICTIWAYQRCAAYHALARMGVAAPAGFIFGSRFMLMLGSDPLLFLCGGVCGTVVFVMHWKFSTKPSRFEPLPQLHLKHGM